MSPEKLKPTGVCATPFLEVFGKWISIHDVSRTSDAPAQPWKLKKNKKNQKSVLN